jgi:hypothetical protein
MSYNVSKALQSDDEKDENGGSFAEKFGCVETLN